MNDLNGLVMNMGRVMHSFSVSEGFQNRSQRDLDLPFRFSGYHMESGGHVFVT